MTGVSEGRSSSDADRLLIARISGIAQRHARWRELTDAEIAVAVAELRAVAGGRPDLLAEEAGILIGFYQDDDLQGPRARNAARLCREAGADEALIPQWIPEGKRRAELRRKPPFSDPARRAPRPQ